MSTPAGAFNDRGSMRGPATTTMHSSGNLARTIGKLSKMRLIKCSPTPDPPTVTMHTRSSDR
jgi:hypothetical protein